MLFAELQSEKMHVPLCLFMIMKNVAGLHNLMYA